MFHPTEDQEALETIVTNLNMRWRLFRDLYDNQQSLDTLNKTSPLIWQILQSTLGDSVFLMIAKLLDPAETFKKPNLSLAAVIKSRCPRSEIRTISLQLDRLRENYRKLIKPWRDRQISHYCADTTLKRKPLPSIRYNEISQIIEEINKIVSDLSEATSGSSISFTPCIQAAWAPALLKAIGD